MTLRAASAALLLALSACAGPGAVGDPAAQLAGRLPDAVADQRRVPAPPGAAALYRSPLGSETSVFLSADPATAALPDGIGSPRLRADYQEALAALLRGALARSPAPRFGAEATIRAPQAGVEILCGAVPRERPAAAELVCLTLVSGAVARLEMTAAPPPGGESPLVYAYAVAVRLAAALRGAALPEPPPGSPPPGPEGAGPVFRT